MVLTLKSVLILSRIHPDLARAVRRAVDFATTEYFEFTVLEGMRTIERQRRLVEQGASKTLKSRHLTGHAVDLGVLVDGQVSWSWPGYHRLASIVKRAAAMEGVDLEWGGDWTRFPDGPHFQLPEKEYPSP